MARTEEKKEPGISSGTGGADGGSERRGATVLTEVMRRPGTVAEPCLALEKQPPPALF